MTVEIRPCSPHIWDYFKDYHYLSHSIHAAPDCYAALINGRPVGFISAGHGVGKTRFFRVGRVVVIPDYQGIGIAKALLTFIGEHYTRLGKLPLTMVTSNPQFIHSKIPGWIITRVGHGSRHTLKQLKDSGSRDRITIGMRYKPQHVLTANL